MNYVLKPLLEKDVEEAVELFNYYIENSFAAYREEKISVGHYTEILKEAKGYPKVIARNHDGAFAGFGLLVPYKAISAFAHSASLICFLMPNATGRGLGRMILKELEARGKVMGVKIILSSISSRNPESLKFHQKNGFIECGRFSEVGKKKGKFFDIIWMQKFLDNGSLQAV
jgi:L-amino acid N-acyltransferase YncA